MTSIIRDSSNQIPAISNVILHAFDWTYQSIADNALLIARLGYRSVLVSPAMKSLKCSSGTEWWQRYQPQDYRIIDNQLGDTNDFKHMVNCLTEVGVWVYVDVVFNHMANESSIRDDLQYPSEAVLREYSNHADKYQSLCLFGDLSQPLFHHSDFLNAFGIQNWNDKWEVQNGRISGGINDPGLPTLSDNEHVINVQRAYLRALKDIGVKGFRIDAAKHMTLEHLNRVWGCDISEDIHIFGEIITDGGATKEEYELFLAPYLTKTKLGAYDFPLFYTLHKAFQKEGALTSLIDPYSYGLALSTLRAITFAINHDIPNNDAFEHLMMPEELEWLAYVYILTREGGVPLIYSDLDTSGIKNKSGQPRWKNSWKTAQMATLIEFHHTMYGKEQTLIESSDEHLVFTRGNTGLVAINKSNYPIRIKFNTEYSWHDLVKDELYHNQEGKIVFEIPAKGYRLFQERWVWE